MRIEPGTFCRIVKGASKRGSASPFNHYSYRVIQLKLSIISIVVILLLQIYRRLNQEYHCTSILSAINVLFPLFDRYCLPLAPKEYDQHLAD
jgi:hypothetical protein